MPEIYCFRCGQKFKTKKSLTTHLTKNSNQCEMKYMDIDKETLANNYDNIHKNYYDQFIKLYNENNNNGYECDVCNMKFANEISFIVHKKDCNQENADTNENTNQNTNQNITQHHPNMGINSLINILEIKNRFMEMELITTILALKKTIAELEGENKLLKYKLKCKCNGMLEDEEE